MNAARRILIFGNSGAGKSTLAKSLCRAQCLAHLDLDTLAWLPTLPPQRKPLTQSATAIAEFIAANNGWVIEGCYTDLLEIAAPDASDIVFLDLPLHECIANARARPWEPHKYATRAEQDANLDMLIDWIAQYTTRDDTFSHAAHRDFYARHAGPKRIVASNDESRALAAGGW